MKERNLYTQETTCTWALALSWIPGVASFAGVSTMWHTGIQSEGDQVFWMRLPRRDPTSSTSDHQLIKATRSLREAYMDYTGSLRKEDDEDPPVKKTQLNWYQMYYMLVSVAPRRLRRSDCSRRRSVLKDKMSKPRLVPSSLLKTLLATSMPWTCPVVRPRMSSTKTILRHRLWGVAWNSL